MKRFKRGFTLAEVLITLAIIGVVAAISIPSVISNSQQQEFKTGLRKAVSVLNSAITMNIAIDGETPYDNGNLFGYFQKHMAVLRSSNVQDWQVMVGNGTWNTNSVFYTTDGMRFEFKENSSYSGRHFLYESPSVALCDKSMSHWYHGDSNSDHYHPSQLCTGCGSYGLNNNSDRTTKPPCLIMVDVNGDRKPNPANINCKYGLSSDDCAQPYKYSDPLGLKLTDLFTIMITDKQAIPYGVAAQRAMYQAQAKK